MEKCASATSHTLPTDLSMSLMCPSPSTQSDFFLIINIFCLFIEAPFKWFTKQEQSELEPSEDTMT